VIARLGSFADSCTALHRLFPEIDNPITTDPSTNAAPPLRNNMSIHTQNKNGESREWKESVSSLPNKLSPAAIVQCLRRRIQVFPKLTRQL